LRGALQGEFDHGVFITTSRFTKDATEASYKKGAITILLLDGDAVAELMLERGIGVVKRPLHLYEVDDDFFDFDEPAG
jgi:restriction system protein